MDNLKGERMNTTFKLVIRQAFLIAVLLGPPVKAADKASFNVVEAGIADIQREYRKHQLTAHDVVQMYLDRIAAYDKQGPTINAVIAINPTALAEADKLDQEFKRTGKFVGPLHGIPILLKDQADLAGLPTTLGSLVMKDYRPTKDAGAVVRMKQAGGIILAKMTLGELGGNDTYGSLFGVTRNPYDLARTVGGSSGGPAAGVNANFGTVGVGEEDVASIRRPAAWNSLVGMRPTPGLVSRSGMWAGYPFPISSLGPMAKSVADAAILLDGMVGYDPEDPVTALGRGHIPASYTQFLDKNGLKGARIGVLHAPMGIDSEPASEDFKHVAQVFDTAVAELRAAGATVIDVEIPGINEAIAKRANNPADDSAAVYFARNPNSPFKSQRDLQNSPEYPKTLNAARAKYLAEHNPPSPRAGTPETRYAEYVTARDRLNIEIMKIMADNNLDVLVHKSVEHTPTLIKDGVNPPYTTGKGVPTLNTFLGYVSSVTVPAGFTAAGLPVGITFFAAAYQEPTIIKFAYAYEQSTHHRVVPKTTPPLSAR